MAIQDDLKLNRIALGIRYDNHFRIEDSLGEIIDDVLDSEEYDATHFPDIGYGPGSRQLINMQRGETLTFSRVDTIYENKKANLRYREIPGSAEDFLSIAWNS